MDASKVRPESSASNDVDGKENAQDSVDDKVGALATAQARSYRERHICQPTDDKVRVTYDVVLTDPKNAEKPGWKERWEKDAWKGQHRHGCPCTGQKVVSAVP